MDQTLPGGKGTEPPSRSSPAGWHLPPRLVEAMEETRRVLRGAPLLLAGLLAVAASLALGFTGRYRRRRTDAQSGRVYRSWRERLPKGRTKVGLKCTLRVDTGEAFPNGGEGEGGPFQPEECRHVVSTPGSWTLGADGLAQFPKLLSLELKGVAGLPEDLLAHSAGLTELALDDTDALPKLAGLPLELLHLRRLRNFRGWDASYFHGLRVLKSLKILDTRGFTRLPDGAFRDLTGLEDLVVARHKGLRSLPGDLLPASRGLTRILFVDNGLTAIEPGWFKHKPALHRVILKHNKIGELAADTFPYHHPEMEYLNLSDNRIRFKEGPASFQDTFKGFPALKLLHLQRNQIERLPPGVLDPLRALEFLRIEAQGGQGLQELPPNLLRQNRALTTVRFMDNQFTSVPPDLLHGLTLMTKVDLSGNRALEAIPDGFFRDAPDMFKLYLYGTSISQLTPQTFGPLTKLGKLRIENCKITRIDPATFSGWTSLTELNLAGNALTEIAEGTFADLVGLRELELGENRLTSLGKGATCPLTRLTRLTLSQRSGAAAAAGAAGCIRIEDFPAPVGRLMARGCFEVDPKYRRCMDPEDPDVKAGCSLGAPGRPPRAGGTRAQGATPTGEAGQEEAAEGPGAARRCPGSTLSLGGRPQGGPLIRRLGSGPTTGPDAAAAGFGWAASILIAAHVGVVVRKLWLRRRASKALKAHSRHGVRSISNVRI